MTQKEIRQKTTENILERIKDHKIFKQISNNKEQSFYMVPENEEERREYKNFGLLLILYLRMYRILYCFFNYIMEYI